MVIENGEQEPLFLSGDSSGWFQQKLNRVLDKCLEFRSGPPLIKDRFPDRDEFRKLCSFSDRGEKLDDILSEFSTHIARHSVNFSSPQFLAHPDNGGSASAILGDFASSLINQNLVSHDYSPAATFLEFELIQFLRRLVGFETRDPENSSILEAAGAFVFGGTSANYCGLHAARERLRARLREQGKVYNPRKVRVLANRPFTHYSMRRSLHMLGLGNTDLSSEQRTELGVPEECLEPVATKNFKMDLDDLERKIELVLSRGEEIMSIFAVAGDSRMMSFDDLVAIRKISDRYNLWVHVDACEGGQCLFGRRQRKLFRGIEEMNSISLDPHKVLMLPYNLSLFLLRDIEDVKLVSIATTVIRLGEGSFGTITPGIGSKNFMSLKLWFLLKHWGLETLANEIDRRHDLAMYAAEKIKKSADMTLLNTEVEHNAVGFVYCPKERLPGMTVADLNVLNEQIHGYLNRESPYFVHLMGSRDDDYILSNKGEMAVHLRMMFGNPHTTEADIDGCLEEISIAGKIAFGDDYKSSECDTGALNVDLESQRIPAPNRRDL